MAEPTFNDFLDLIRPELDRKVGQLRRVAAQLESQATVRGISGNLVDQVLNQCDATFEAGANDAFASLKHVSETTELEPEQLFQLTVQSLANFILAIKAATNPDKLKRIVAPALIDGRLAAVDQRLTTMARQYKVGLLTPRQQVPRPGDYGSQMDERSPFGGMEVSEAGAAMAASGDFVNFRATYDFYTDEVMGSHVQFLADHLANWFRTLDTTSSIAPIIQKLQSGLDFEKWRQEQQAAASGMGGTLVWPNTREKQLGMKLLLFRSAADEHSPDLISWFGFIFIPSSDRSIDAAARRFVEQVFGPMARQLRRYLEERASAVPASDRTVPLTHNSPQYVETMEAAENLETVIRQANDFPDVEEREQRVAEVSAVRRLLQAARIRVDPIISLLKPLAEQVKTKLRDTLIGMAVTKFLALLGALIGYIWMLL